MRKVKAVAIHSEHYHWYWLVLGPLALRAEFEPGCYMSFGIHISWLPPSIDVFFFWAIFGITSRGRAEEIIEAQTLYGEENENN